MKILHLVTKRQYRGAEVFAANLSAELIKLGHEIVFAGLYENHKDVLHVPGAQNIDLTGSKTKFFSPVVVKKIVTLIKKTEPDVVQCNGSDTLKYMVAASYFVPKVPILYRNISMISRWLIKKPNRLLYQFFFRRVSHVSSVGKKAVDDFVLTCNYPKERTSVIRRGIPFEEIKEEQAREQLLSQVGLEKEDRIVMHIGNFSPEKNHLFLLDIFSDFQKTHPEVKLICVGDGILFDTIKDEVRNRGLERTVYLLGFRKDIPQLLAAADCFVLSSLVEGVPGVVLEAAIQKKPTVATNVGGVGEVLENGKTGFIINDFSQNHFSGKLVELLSDQRLRKELGENAYRLAMEEYNPGKNAKKFEDLYYSLMEEKSSVPR